MVGTNRRTTLRFVTRAGVPLAAVLAHEAGHEIGLHSVEKLTFSIFTQYTGKAVHVLAKV